MTIRRGGDLTRVELEGTQGSMVALSCFLHLTTVHHEVPKLTDRWRWLISSPTLAVHGSSA